METLIAILVWIAATLIVARFFAQFMWLYGWLIIIGFIFGVYVLFTKVAPDAIYKHDVMSIIAVLVFVIFVFLQAHDVFATRKANKAIEEWLTLQNRVISKSHNGSYNLTSEDRTKFAEWKKLHSK